MKDLTILMDQTVGRPAQMLADATSAGIAVNAACLFPRLGGRVAHVAVNRMDVQALTAIVEKHGGIVADERECVIVPADYEGGPVKAATRLAEAQIPVQVAYFGSNGELVMATADVDGTRAALGL